MKPAKGKPDKKPVFSQYCGDETTTCYNRANLIILPRCNTVDLHARTT